jgi:anti-sigma B factor antagonist
VTTQMNIEGAVATVAPVGELDMAAVEELETMGTIGLAQGPSVLRIDLKAVTFMDSSGISGLVALRNKALEGGQTLVVDNACERVLKILELVGLTTTLNVTGRGHADPVLNW